MHIQYVLHRDSILYMQVLADTNPRAGFLAAHVTHPKPDTIFFPLIHYLVASCTTRSFLRSVLEGVLFVRSVCLVSSSLRQHGPTTTCGGVDSV